MARASFKAFSARAYLAAETIFMDLVIFWMLVTLFRRMETVGKEEKNDKVSQEHNAPEMPSKE